MSCIVMEGVREHEEGRAVELHTVYHGPCKGRLAVVSYSYGRDGETCIDLVDLLRWARTHRKDLWDRVDYDVEHKPIVGGLRGNG